MTTVNSTLQLDESSEAVDAQFVASLSKLPSGYAVRAEPGLIVLIRRYRPGWATTLAILALLLSLVSLAAEAVLALLFLLGLLFLLVKRTETLRIDISPRGEGGCTVVVAGEASDWVSSRIRTTLTTLASRACPNCKRPMKRNESVCPHCHSESQPWTHHAGFWWCQSASGEWQWLDKTVNTWRWYRDGTPSSPSAADTTPSRALDPAFVEPPAAHEPDVPWPVDEIEQVVARHARGALTDEEFQAAMDRLLGL